MKYLALTLTPLIAVLVFVATPSTANAGGIYIGSGIIEVGDIRIGIGSVHRPYYHGKTVHYYPGYKKVIRYGPYGKRIIHNRFYDHGFHRPYYRKHYRPHRFYRRGHRDYYRGHKFERRYYRGHRW